MKKQKLILITGKKRAGKDFTADYLLRHIRGKKYSFADPLKVFCMRAFGLTHEQCFGDSAAKESLSQIPWENLPFSHEKLQVIQSRYTDNNYYLTARQILEIFGTDVCRGMNNQCWVEMTSKIVVSESPDWAIIADCRFPNEIDYFLNHENYYDPIVIRLTRNPYNSQAASETALDQYKWYNIKKYIEIDNQNLSIEQKNEIINDLVIQKIYKGLL